MQISLEQVKQTAARARLCLRDEEVVALRQQLQDLVDHAGEIAVAQEKPATTCATFSLPAAASLWQIEGLKQQEVLALAADSERGFIRVPRVLNDD